MVTIHSTCVLVAGIGVLLRGPSGSGKSDVALRLIDAGARLVADDRVELRMDEGKLIACAPAALAGLLEVRGVGILRVPAEPRAVVGLVADLAPRERIERLPASDTDRLLDIALPRIDLAPFEASAAAKLRAAAAAVGAGTLFAVPEIL